MKIKIHSVSLCNKLNSHSTEYDVNLSNASGGKSKDRWWWLLEINFFPYRFTVFLSDILEWKLINIFITHVLIFELEVDDVVARFLLENEVMFIFFGSPLDDLWCWKIEIWYSHRQEIIIRKISFWFNLICFFYFTYFFFFSDDFNFFFIDISFESKN